VCPPGFNRNKWAVPPGGDKREPQNRIAVMNIGIKNHLFSVGTIHELPRSGIGNVATNGAVPPGGDKREPQEGAVREPPLRDQAPFCSTIFISSSVNLYYLYQLVDFVVSCFNMGSDNPDKLFQFLPVLVHGVHLSRYDFFNIHYNALPKRKQTPY